MVWHYMGWWPILFWLLIIGGLSYLFWVYTKRGSYTRDDPIEVARRRLASGEITEEEYDRIVRRLKEG